MLPRNHKEGLMVSVVELWDAKWTSNNKTGLTPDQVIPGLSQGRTVIGIGVEDCVAVLETYFTVEFIRAGLQHGIEHTAYCAPDLSVVRRGLHIQFLHSDQRRDITRIRSRVAF